MAAGAKGGGQLVTDYYMSLHLGVSTRADAITGIYIDKKKVWEGSYTTLTTIPINLPDFNGGEGLGGGLQGRAFYLPGDVAQVMPGELASRLGLAASACPAFRELATVFFVGDSGGTAGFKWSANNPVVAQNVSVRVKRAPKGLDPTIAMLTSSIDVTTVTHTEIESDGTNYVTTTQFLTGQTPPITIDTSDTVTTGTLTVNLANPAHIIYEVMTDLEQGMGASVGVINVASFAAAAQTLYNEGLGLSLAWTDQSTIEDFVNEILGQIQGVLFLDPATGLWNLKLVRNDYDPSTLPVYSPDNATLTNYQRKLWGETVNQIDVTWTNPINEARETITVQDLGNIAVQGGVVSDSRNFYGVRTSALATQLGMRDLRTASAPLRSVELAVDRSAWDSKPGDLVKVNWPEYRLSDLIVRIGTVDYGKAGDPHVKVTAVEDIFSLPLSASVVPGPVSASAPVGTAPAPLAQSVIFTVPSFLANLAGLTGTYPEVAAGALGSAANANASGFVLMADSGGSFTSVGNKSVTGRGVLAVALAAEAQSLLPDAIFGNKGKGPIVGGLLFIGNTDGDFEIASVISFDGTNWTIGRGVLDTVPTAWAIATPVWALSSGANVIDTQTSWAAGESADYKLLTKTSQGTLDISAAPLVSATLSARPWLPLRPANVQINGVGFGDVAIGVATTLAITWATRNRTLEEGHVVLWTDAPVTPEYRQGTVVTVKDSGGTLIYQQTGLWTDAGLTLPVSDFAHYSEIYVTVSSSRDGLDSLHGYTLHVTGLPGTSGAPPPPTPPVAGPPPSPVVAPVLADWTVTGTSIIDGAGASIPAIQVTGAPSDNPAAEGLAITYKRHVDTTWLSNPLIPLGDEPITTTLTGLAPLTAYDVELSYQTAYGEAGAILSTAQAYGPVTTGALSAGPQPFGFAYSRRAEALTPSVPFCRFDQGIAWSLPAGLPNARAEVDGAPTSTTVFGIWIGGTIVNDALVGGTNVGSMTFAASSTTATFTFASTQAVASGVAITIVPPGNLNGMKGLMDFAIVGTR